MHSSDVFNLSDCDLPLLMRIIYHGNEITNSIEFYITDLEKKIQECRALCAFSSLSVRPLKRDNFIHGTKYDEWKEV